MTKKKQQISSLKTLYLAIIVLLPIYAAFALQFVPREHEGDYAGGQGWPFLVCGPVDQVSDVGLLLANASIIFSAIYILVLGSAMLRFRLLGQAADGTPLKKTKRKKS